MNGKIFYEVGTFVENSDPESLCEFSTIQEAEKEFESQKYDLQCLILDAMRRNDRCLHDLSRRTVELNKVEVTYYDDGEIDECETQNIMFYGEAADWDELRERL